MSSDLIKRAINGSEESNKITKRCVDELIPNYFFMGFLLGGEFKDIEKMQEKFKDKEFMEFLMEMYNKGKENTKKSMFGLKCSKCGKEGIKEDDVKFCKYCGEKL